MAEATGDRRVPTDGRRSRWADHRAARRDELIDAAIVAVRRPRRRRRHGPDRRRGPHQQAGDLPLLRRQARPVPRGGRAGGRRRAGRAAAATADEAEPRELIARRHRRLPALLERQPRAVPLRHRSTAALRRRPAAASPRPSTSAPSRGRRPRPTQLGRAAARPSGSTRRCAQPWGEAIVGFIQRRQPVVARPPASADDPRQQLADYLTALLWGGVAGGLPVGAGQDVDARPAPGSCPARRRRPDRGDPRRGA